LEQRGSSREALERSGPVTQPGPGARLIGCASQRILVADGAIGTRVRQLILGEDAFRGEKLSGHSRPLTGNIDVLTLSQPALIRTLHDEYLAAGADIIQTNTFGASAIVQEAYGLEAAVFEMNCEAARIARAAADEHTARTPHEPRFVAGCIGPTTENLGRSGGGNERYERMQAAFVEQVRGLLAGGVDLLSVETVVDSLTTRACLDAIEEVSRSHGSSLPVIVSATVTDDSGRLATGQSATDFWRSVERVDPIGVGVNCAWGESRIAAIVGELARIAPTVVVCRPSAGLPNAVGVYEQTPASIARFLETLARRGLVNVVGGCCGTTPEHVEAFSRAVRHLAPRGVPDQAPAGPDP
jgi:5-methyltetrahydrofolate--homocysteine methyltransferase